MHIRIRRQETGVRSQESESTIQEKDYRFFGNVGMLE